MYVVSYDIPGDRIRNKVSKELCYYGKRVQYSVFECNISGRQMTELYAKLTSLLQGEDGSIRIYNQCAVCLKRLSVIGDSEERKEVNDLFVL